MTLDYLVGIIDGEGTVAIFLENGKKAGKFGSWHARLSVANTHKGLIDELVKYYGGFVHVRKQHNPKWKESYCWIRSLGKKDAEFVKELGSRSIIKREQFSILSEYMQTYSAGRGYHLGKEGYNKRLELKEALTKANNSWHAATTTKRERLP